MTPPHPVIAISGIPGAGKSHACARLAGQLGLTYLGFDSFEVLTARPPHEVRHWLDRGAPLDEMYHPALDGVLADLAARGPVLFETPLGRLPPAHGRLIRCAIWIEVERDIALARKLGATLSAGGWTDTAEMTAWVSDFLLAYESLVRPCLAVQAARVKGQSDHVVDGLDAADIVADRIARIIGPILRGC
ncbi:hypothetical protein SAMN05878503_11830 [Cereibacter ovatus]|uniref:Uncharacterized protein n=1 Tax=Cereibacter ovatus TaxID=439529 RepID=A0A285D2D3_9RHOB|nr:hypothetical protein [Cereibacter ovatus]SNX73974.1 hypothetical protein SAMN05878503_11830 [Cereibacter ovatus]